MTDQVVEGDPKRPRRRWITWLLIAVAILAVPAVLALLLFGPSPPIRVAKETTYLTEPLAEDGLPDYAAALLNEGRAGVTPENNGAIDYLAVVWRPPGTEDALAETRDQAARLFEALGMQGPPDEKHRIGPLKTDANARQAFDFLRSKFESLSDAERQAAVDAQDSAAWQGVPITSLLSDKVYADRGRRVGDNWLDAYCTPVERPFTSDDLPVVAAWCQENEPAFAKLHEAARKPRWWLPCASLFDAPRGGLLAVLLPDMQQLRSVARSLQTHAMWLRGQGRHAEAAASVATTVRLAQHARSKPFLVGQLVACAIEGIAHTQAVGLASDPAVSADALREVLAAIEACDSSDPMRRAMTHTERMWALDALTSVVQTGEFGPVDLDGTGPAFLLRSVALDWNVVLTRMNEQYDAVDAAMSHPTRAARARSLSNWEASIDAEMQQAMPDSVMSVMGVIASRQRRGELAADMLGALFLPALSACETADARLVARRQLTATALRVAIYQRQNGAYPDALSPDVFPEPPPDVFTGEPLAYEKTDDGFLLYTFGANATDEGGSRELSDWGLTKHRGVELTDADDPRFDDIPANADDLSVRVPTEYEPFPWDAILGDD